MDYIYLLKKKYINLNYLVFLLLPLSFVIGPLIVEIFSFILITFLFFHKKKMLQFSNINLIKILVILQIYLIINSLINLDNNFHIFQTIFFFRVILLITACCLLIENNKKILKIFFYLLFVLIFIIFIDVSYQYFEKDGKNFLGFITPESNDRLSSFFNDEMVLGSFIVRLLPLLLIAYLVLKKNIFIIGIVMSIPIVTLSGERTSFGLMIIFLIFIFLFLKPFKLKFKLITLFTAILMFLYVLITNQHYLNRYIILTKNEFSEKKVIFYTPKHNSLYFTSINMFKDKPILGHGYKSFRLKCSKLKFSYDINSCSTHSHSYILQFMSEFGLLGLLIYLSLLLVFLSKIFKYIFFEKQYSLRTNVLFVLSVGGLINFFPLLPSGNFFNNWLMFLNFFILIFYLYFDRVKLNKFNK